MIIQKNRGITFIIVVLMIGYLIGTMTHIIHLSDVIRLGFINSAKTCGVSPIINGYWLSLTIIDPAVVFFLLIKRKIGILIAFINILINVTINSYLQIASLTSVSLFSIYNALGNIGQGLQIALFLFSLFTLPLFYVKTGMDSRNRFSYAHIFNLIPIIALATGLIIHITGLISLIHRFESLWILWVHFSMTIIDGTLIYALWNKLRSGYIISIIGFSIFGLIQAGFAGANYMGFNCAFNLAMAVTISVCCLSISALLLSGDIYTSTVRQSILKMDGKKVSETC